jgi:hypothetical protein
MGTPAQHTANQSNAQLSTGPKTPDGKARVSQNAVRHGLTAKHLVVRDDEQEEFTALRDELLAELDPQGATEILTFNDLLHSSWNLQRFRRIEAECSLGSIDDFTNPQTTAVLDRLTRYQTRSQRAYHRALQELRTLQTNRALRRLKLDEETAAETPAITDINQFAKQSRSEVTAEALDLALKMTEYEVKTFQRNAFHSKTQPKTAPTSPGAEDLAHRL